MNVADLQELLDNVGRLLATAGARAGVVNELAVFREDLEPFRELTLKKLTALLAQADAARGAAPAPRGGRRSGGGGQARPDTEALAREVHALYERAADPAVSEGDIDALAARLAPLGKDGLLSVAAAIELKVAKSKNKGQIIGEIRQRILARKSVNQRAHLLGHPGEKPAEAAPATDANGASGDGVPSHTPRAFSG